MFIKRIHKKDENGAPARLRGTEIPGKKMLDENGKEFTLPPTYEEGDVAPPIGIEILSLGRNPEQHFTPRFVEGALKHGWLEMGQNNTLTLKGLNAVVPYTIKRPPGYYCLHCHEKIDFDDKGANARIHVAAHHKGAPSPQPQRWPGGYERINYYECVESLPRNKTLKGKTNG